MTFPHGIDLSTDWHCHLLPGLDDGPATLEESLEMARLLATAGVRIVHCTPHYIKGSYEYTPDEVRQAVAALQEELNKHKIKLELRAGMEYLLDEFFQQQLRNPLPLGTTNFLLVEAPPSLAPEYLTEHIFNIVRNGYQPLLAHPERNALLAPQKTLHRRAIKSFFICSPHKPQLPIIENLRSLGCQFQGNLGSICGYYGKPVKHAAEILMETGVYDYWGSDSHSVAQCRSTMLL